MVPIEHLVPHITAIISGESPFDEDDKGQNALHRLATCIFKVSCASGKVRQNQSPLEFFVNRSPKDSEFPGSSHLCPDLINFRHSLLEDFLARGVDVNAYNSFGNTVLMEFVIHSLYEGGDIQPSSILEVLIRHGARVNARNRDGETALHLAAKHGRRDAMDILIKNGANIHARNRKGQSSLQILGDLIGHCKDANVKSRSLDDCYKWLSSKPIGCLLQPSILDECSSGNIWLESAQLKPSVEKKINNILSRLHSEKKDAEISLDQFGIGKKYTSLGNSGDEEADQNEPSANEPQDTIFVDEYEAENDSQSQHLPTTEHLEDVTFLDKLCGHITSSVFGISASHLVYSEAILQSVASCVDKISSLIQQEQHFIACTPGQAQRHDQSFGISDYNQYTLTRPSKRRKLEKDDDSQDLSERSHNERRRSSAKSRGPSHARVMKTDVFSCPYRRRNGFRFNCRDHRNCAYRPFNGLSQVK